MKISIYILLAFFSILLSTLTSCEKEEIIDEGKSWDELETEISEKYKNHPKWTWDQYRMMLEELSQDKYIVLPVYEMKDYFDSTKVVVSLRHDVDVQIFKALEMASVEHFYGFRSTYYILATSPYYGKFVDNKMIRNRCMEDAYLRLDFLGHEIGIHNDLLTVMIRYKNDPLLFNKEEIEFYKSLGITIYGSASHGSYIARQTVGNYRIFSDFATTNEVEYLGEKYTIGNHSLAEYGFTYEAYFIDHNKYFSEAGGHWGFDNDYDGMMQALQNSKPGDRIEILTHPAWWGK